MKQYHLWIAALVLMLGTTIYAQDIRIYISNESIEMDVTPEIKEDTMYVPISFISKSLGANVKWENPKVIITKGTSQVVCTIGDKTAYKNGRQVELPNAPYMSSNRTFIPLRSISKLLSCNVDYQKQTNRINITPNYSQGIAERMKELNAMDYCVVGDWVYYVVLGDHEGFHKILLNGTQYTFICDFSNVRSIGGSVGVTSEYKGDYILYKMQSLRQYDANGNLEDPYPIDYYRLNLSDDTLEPIDR